MQSQTNSRDAIYNEPAMALIPGSRLGPYEIQAALGAGGMGEVYRARDTRLERAVAIKVIPTHLCSNADLKQRFEREARAISALAHPNICRLYDVGAQDGVDYLVMEYLSGQNLAERLRQGPLPLEQVLTIGIEIADALQTAHRHGIIHRDLKPANIMLSKSQAKLTDFGAAKPVVLAGAGNVAAIPTLTGSSPLTAEGTIIGTLQYMAPEQLQGSAADQRCDIFALGCVLYEMITGKAAFGAGSPASVIAAVLVSEPPSVTTLQPQVPALLDWVIRTALSKNPDDRWQSAHDLKLQLKWTATHLAEEATSLARQPGRASTSLHPTRSSILPPANTSFVAHNFSISPDGRHLAFIAMGEDGHNSLWVRSFHAARAQQLAGTEAATYPFWSAASSSIGFFADGKLKTIELSSGAVRVVTGDAPAGRGGTWNRDGTIVFAPSTVGPLMSVPAAGGTAVPVTRTRPGSGQGHRWPMFLPDGRHFLLFVDWSSPADQETDGIYVASLDSPELKLVSTEITGSVAYSAGRMIFVHNRSLMAQRFDLAGLQLTGSPAPLVEEELQKDLAFSDSNFSASAGGVIVFYSAVDSASQLLWLDRSGNEIGRVPGSGFMDARISPDGHSLAISYDPAKNGKYYIYIYNLARGLMTRLTTAGFDMYPVWSRDSRTITYVSGGGREYRLFEVPADGSGPPQLLLAGGKMIPNDWSPDGKRLLYMDFEGLPHLASYSPADQSREPVLFGAEGQFSPDGQWLAHVEPGIYSEVWIQKLPAGAHLQISSGGGAQARWSPDGLELFYMAADRKLMAVSFDKKTNLPGSSKVLFQTRVIAPNFVLWQFDVMRGRKRFIVNSLPPPGTVPMTLLSNWTADLDD